VVIIGNRTGPLPTDNVFGIVEFNGGSWGTFVDVTTNAIAVMTNPFGYGAQEIGVAAILDASDVLHIFFDWLDNPPNNYLFYQQVSASNVLGSFYQFPGYQVTTPQISAACWMPFVAGNSIVYPTGNIVGAYNTEAGIWVGTPLAAPVWTLFSTIDPGHVFTGGIYTATNECYGVFDGTTVNIFYTPDGVTIRQLTTTDLVTWVFSGKELFNRLTSPVPPGFRFSGQYLNPQRSFILPVPTLGIEFSALAPNGYTMQRFFLPNIQLPASLHFDQQNMPSKALPDPTKPGCN
jgi:hypothetical protein